MCWLPTKDTLAWFRVDSRVTYHRTVVGLLCGLSYEQNRNDSPRAALVFCDLNRSNGLGVIV